MTTNEEIIQNIKKTIEEVSTNYTFEFDSPQDTPELLEKSLNEFFKDKGMDIHAKVTPESNPGVVHITYTGTDPILREPNRLSYMYDIYDA